MYGIIARVTGFEQIGSHSPKAIDMNIAYDEHGMPSEPLYSPTDIVIGGRGEFNLESPRRLFAALREADLLSEYSKGKVALREHNGFAYIIDKDNYHPLFVIMPSATAEELATAPTFERSICNMINADLIEAAKLLGIDTSEEEMIREESEWAGEEVWEESEWAGEEVWEE